jgi:aryl-alcohol dehydrogenase-like predicted oxidoreductase
MEYTTLGATGTKVSRIGIGCYNYGDQFDWMLDEEEATEIIERALDLGINFFDTANVYSRGRSEEILGSALSGYDRDAQVIATKVRGQMDPDNPNSGGLSRKAISQELEHSLERLGVDTVDLYQIHRWDDETPIEETLAALTAAIDSGKIQYMGASSMWAYQLATALHTSRRRNLESFVTMQNHYNLAFRDEEREMVPLCQQEGLGMIPWSPLARGFLTRPHEEQTATDRGSAVMDDYPEYAERGGIEINERVQELAAEYDATMAQIGLAWLFTKEYVDAPILGTTSVEHVEQAVEALDIDLTESDVEYLEEPYRATRGFWDDDVEPVIRFR